MYPNAEIPVVQLSIDASKDPDYHLNLGAALAPLRQRGVLIFASGNVVHNLRQLDWQQPDHAYPWATEFNQAPPSSWPNDQATSPSSSATSTTDLAAPTPDHLLPLFYIAGLAATAGSGTTPASDGYAMGSLSMTSHLLGPS